MYDADKQELFYYNVISGAAKVSEGKLDSRINDYIETTETPKNYVKQLQWDMAIGLQEVDNTLFKEKSVYFRNALVRSNYFNRELNIKENNTFLIKFYENLLLGKNNNLHSKDLIVEELFDKKN